MPSNHLILCHPRLLLLSIFSTIRVFSTIRIFSSELAAHIRGPKFWSFRFSISPSSEYSGLISVKIDWFDLLAVQGTLKSLLQHHSSKALILWCSPIFTVQLSHPYLTTEKKTQLWLFRPLSYDFTETMEIVTDFIYLDSKITADFDYRHEIKRCLLFGRKAMTNLDSILKSRDITLPEKIYIVKAMVFP